MDYPFSDVPRKQPGWKLDECDVSALDRGSRKIEAVVLVDREPSAELLAGHLPCELSACIYFRNLGVRKISSFA